MDKTVMETCNLRQKTKYCDLEIKCDGTTFYVHRLIVCEKSKVLARECDGSAEKGSATAIEHVVFDAHTLERMLHFMYRGDYNVPSTNEPVASADEGLNEYSKSNAAAMTIPPHLRKAAPGALSLEQRNAKSPYGPVTAHVYVYAIAHYYEMADLKALALRRFKNANAAMGLREFLGVVKAVYLSTVGSDDELRHELLLTLMNNHIGWLTDGDFVRALSSDIELHAFSVAVTSATSEKFLEKIAILQTDVETQHRANVQLHCGLDQAIQDRAQANREVTKLQEDLEKTDEARSRLEERLQTSERWGRENFEKAENNRKAVQERDELLEKETARADRLSLVTLRKDEEIQEHKEEIRQKNEIIKQKDLKIKEGADRAHQYADVVHQKTEEIKNKDKTIKQETDRADKAMELVKKLREVSRQKDEKIKEESDRADRNYELCTQRDHTIKVKDGLCKEATQNFALAQMLINGINECRHCAEPFVTLLQKDSRTDVYMLRCNECQTRHFSIHV